MAFNPRDYGIEVWLRLEAEGILQKQCRNFDEDGLLVEEYRTRVQVKPVGNALFTGKISVSAPSLYRSFTYDDAENAVASLPQMREWSQACEDAAQGAYTDAGNSVISISKSSTKYSYAEVSSIPIGSTVSVYTRQLLPDEHIFLRHVIAGGDCIAKFQVLADGQPVATKRTWWTKWDTDFWFNTSNGGIIYQNEELLEVRVTNIGENLGDFEVSVGVV